MMIMAHVASYPVVSLNASSGHEFACKSSLFLYTVQGTIAACCILFAELVTGVQKSL